MTIRVRCQYSQYRWSGVPTRYADLVRYLGKTHYQFDLHGTSDLESDNELPGWLQPFNDWLKWFIGRNDTPWYRLAAFGAEVDAMQSCKAQHTDIIHFMDGEQCGQFLPRRIRELGIAGVKTVATFHQPPDVIRELINEETLRWLDAIILVSPTQLPFFKDRVAGEKLHMILLGVDTERFSPPAQKRQNDRTVCITTGLHLRDWETFTKVARMMPDVTFRVVTSSRIKFEEMPNLELHTGISDAALADLYRTADILFLPLIDTTANNTLLEGIASGLPVVATDHASVRAYLPNSEAILVAGNRAEGFVAAIRRLQQDPALARDMGRKSRARAEQLSWQAMSQQYDEVYSSLHEQTAPAAAAPQPQLAAAALKAPPHRQREKLQERFQRASVSPQGSDAEDVEIFGEAMLELGLTQEAAGLFQGLSQVGPGEVVGHAGLAGLAAKEWKWREAIASVDKALAAAPADAQTRLIARKASYLVHVGDVIDAEKLLHTIRADLEGLVGLARLAALGLPAEARKYWAGCAKQFPDRPDGFLGQAANLIACGHYAEADAALDHVMGIWPKLPAARILWARCATNAKKMELAGARWNALLAMGVRDSDAQLGYARYLGLVDDRAQADRYLAAIDASPAEQAEFLFEYDSASGNLDSAVQQAQALSALPSAGLTAHLREAAVHMDRDSEENLARADAILHGALEKAPDSVIVKAELAELQIRQGKYQQARQTLQTINPQDKRSQFEILRLGVTLSERSDVAALAHWRSLFLDLGGLAAIKNFSPELRQTALRGFY